MKQYPHLRTQPMAKVNKSSEFQERTELMMSCYMGPVDHKRHMTTDERFHPTVYGFLHLKSSI